MALTQQQLAEIAAWVDQYAAATDQLSAQTAAVITAAYSGVNMYNAAAVAAASAQAADASNTSALLAAGLASQYLALVTSQMVGAAVGVPNLPVPPLRNGVDLTRVFERVAKLYRRQVAKGIPADRAWEQALRLAESLTDYNIRLAERDAFSRLLTYLEPRLGIAGYRRVVHPERSKTGTCGLCLVASDNVYSVGVLMPLHARCKCGVAPIIGDLDPGNTLNNLSLKDVYAAAGGTTDGQKLKQVRYQVNEHGELGPVLTVAGHRYTGRNQIEGYDPSKATEVRAANQQRIDELIAGINAAVPPTPPRPPVPPAPPIPSPDDDGFRGRALAQLGAPPEGDPGDYWDRRKALLPPAFASHLLESHEVEFIERFLDAGEQLEWIAKGKSHPTNDFVWISNGGLLTELKSPESTGSAIPSRIEGAVRRAINHPWRPLVKDNFVIDLGDDVLSQEMREALAGYNEGRRKYRIARLWVMSGGQLDEITLRT